MINTKGGSLYLTKTVSELLFDGYDDELLKFLKSAESPAFDLPFDSFAWFVDRNLSSTFDGRINMNTGENDITSLGVINSWNGNNRTRYYRDNCGKVNGTTGELWYPNIDPVKPITLFATDLCRSLTLSHDSFVERYGVSGSKWVGDDRLFDNGEKYPDTQCFCSSEPNACPDLKPGVLNVSECRYGAPAFVSYPHFYLADDSYLQGLNGMKPDKEKHQFSISLEPSTGIPLEVNARLQINILLQPITKLS